MMQKEFNDTGVCVPDRHYMVDMTRKIDKIILLVEQEKYFSINRPRQFGKTTILSLLAKRLNQRNDCLALKISFEEIDTDTYQQQDSFIHIFLDMLIRELKFLHLHDLAKFIAQQIDTIKNIPHFSGFVTTLVRDMLSGKGLVLLIDEVDKSLNNQLFLDFLGMLRNKYLQRNEGRDFTFQSVILAGVHDVKTLKTNIRADDKKRFNSPWNIAVDFTVNLSFNLDEIETMLIAYAREKNIAFDLHANAKKLLYYTSGYPYLVSKLCKFIDEHIIPQRECKHWTSADVDEAFRMMVDEGYTTTIFDSLTKNLENNSELYDAILNMVINGQTMSFTIADPIIALGHMYGIFAKSADGRCQIHNRIFEQRIYVYMMSKLMRKRYSTINGHMDAEYFHGDMLNVKLILQKFQAFMKEHCSRQDHKFLEREGRLLFLSFIRPIINGKGFEFKEPNVGDERRMDIVITYKKSRYVIELKRWYGPKAHQEGIRQLCNYLDLYSLTQGYLLIYNFNKNKEYQQEDIMLDEKRIFAVWV